MSENNVEKKRWDFLLIIISLIFIYLMSGLVWLQIVNGRENAQKAAYNSIRRIPIPAARGTIYDNQKEILVNSVPGYSITLSYMSEDENRAVIERLVPLLIEQRLIENFDKEQEDDQAHLNDIDGFNQYVEANEALYSEELLQAMIETVEAKRYYKRYEPVKLAPLPGKTIRHVTDKVVAAIEESRSELPNVVVEIQPQRQYKLGNIAFHLIGGINPVDRVGREGLELSYDTYLTGTDGQKLVEVNAYGRPTNTLGIEEPKAGANLFLTVNADIQVTLENAILDSMEKTRQKIINDARYKGEPAPEIQDLPYSGAGIVMDVKTGAILAMASFPQVDRDNYAAIWNEADPFVARFRPGTNWVTGASRPPGSILKPLIAIAALENDIVSLQDMYYCDGAYNGLTESWVHSLKCWKREGHGGPQNISAGLKNSCNLVFYPIGERMGLDLMSTYYTKFGFGRLSGLQDFEFTYLDDDDVPHVGYATSLSKGLVVDTSKFMEIHTRKPYSAELAQAGIGQGDFRVNPLQVALYTSMIANAQPINNEQYLAQRMRPFFVDQVIDKQNEILYQAKVEVLDEVIIEKEALDATREGMRQVTDEAGGTAYAYFHKYNYQTYQTEAFLPFEIAGKTGTAQEYGWNNHGWFISYAPYEDPEIAVVVLIEQGMAGGSTGAPVALAVYKEYFNIVDNNE